MTSRIYTSRVTIGGRDIFELTADPNGILQASAGSLGLRGNIIPSETWRNVNGGTTWEQLGSGAGGMQIIKKRIQLVDLPANTSFGLAFDDIVPAHKPIMGAFLYIAQAPTGGGVGSCQATVTDLVTFATFIELEQMVGSPNGEYIPILNANPTGLTGTNHLNIQAVDRGMALSLNSDVNLDTLATFDVTAYVAYADVTGLP